MYKQRIRDHGFHILFDWTTPDLSMLTSEDFSGKGSSVEFLEYIQKTFLGDNEALTNQGESMAKILCSKLFKIRRINGTFGYNRQIKWFVCNCVGQYDSLSRRIVSTTHAPLRAVKIRGLRSFYQER